MNNTSVIDSILKKGAIKAREDARLTLDKIRAEIGID